jgi:hypothetical protein
MKLETSKKPAVLVVVRFDEPGSHWGMRRRGQTGFFDIDERLRELSAKGDELEGLNALVDFELFRGDLERAVQRSDRSRGGRPAFDHVLMFKAVILQASTARRMSEPSI